MFRPHRHASSILAIASKHSSKRPASSALAASLPNTQNGDATRQPKVVRRRSVHVKAPLNLQHAQSWRRQKRSWAERDLEVDGPELDENELMSQEEVYEQIQTLVKDNSGLQPNRSKGKNRQMDAYGDDFGSFAADVASIPSGSKLRRSSRSSGAPFSNFGPNTDYTYGEGASYSRQGSSYGYEPSYGQSSRSGNGDSLEFGLKSSRGRKSNNGQDDTYLYVDDYQLRDPTEYRPERVDPPVADDYSDHSFNRDDHRWDAHAATPRRRDQPTRFNDFEQIPPLAEHRLRGAQREHYDLTVGGAEKQTIRANTGSHVSWRQEIEDWQRAVYNNEVQVVTVGRPRHMRAMYASESETSTRKPPLRVADYVEFAQTWRADPDQSTDSPPETYQPKLARLFTALRAQHPDRHSNILALVSALAARRSTRKWVATLVDEWNVTADAQRRVKISKAGLGHRSGGAAYVPRPHYVPDYLDELAEQEELARSGDLLDFIFASHSASSPGRRPPLEESEYADFIRFWKLEQDAKPRHTRQPRPSDDTGPKRRYQPMLAQMHAALQEQHPDREVQIFTLVHVLYAEPEWREFADRLVRRWNESAEKQGRVWIMRPRHL